MVIFSCISLTIHLYICEKYLPGNEKKKKVCHADNAQIYQNIQTLINYIFYYPKAYSILLVIKI